jgi:hypothetical protein
MKKLLVLFVAGVFVLGLAGPAMADLRIWEGTPRYSFSVGGQIEIDGFWRSNFDYDIDEDSFSGDNRFYNQETRLDFKGTYGDVLCRIRLEWDMDWSSANQNKSTGTGATDGRLQQNYDLGWVQFPVPATPLYILAGLAPYNFGKSLYFDDSQYMMVLALTYENGRAALGTIKWEETFEDRNDRDGYFFLASYNMAAVNIEGFIYWEDNQGKRDAITDQDTNPANVGVFAEGAAGNVNWAVEAHFNWGDEMEGTQKVDRRGWALGGLVDTNMGGFDLGLAALYTSGDDDPTDGKNNAYVDLAHDFVPDLVMVDNLVDPTDLWFIVLNGTWSQDNHSLMGAVGFYGSPQESRVPGESYLGTELDGVYKYNFQDQFSVKAAFGYVINGDGIALGHDKDPWEANLEFALNY